MKTFKWKDKISGETFALSCQHQFYKDAEKEKAFLSWAGNRILERTIVRIYHDKNNLI